ncbi:hypothetical protein [Streptomyces sp. AK02-01A]|uniref:hypothetical protein n=1 Tax=Streptomyces sp. AK02-01A TaxID=3028648 RepID=UPI0029A2BBC8|nr:hypothetical protein [Streptomyces sp. AK02-01A]MDX3853983.1 hypothetical protein [Streptomyces sp. AK02-01A]
MRERYGPGTGMVLGALAGALVLAGCVDSGPAGSKATPVASPGSAASRPERPDPRACADADCEVELAAGDTVRFDGRAGVDRFEVTAVGPQGATWNLPGSRQCGASGPGHIQVAGDQDGCRGTVGEGTTLRAEGVTVTFLEVGRRSVVVRLRPRA